MSENYILQIKQILNGTKERDSTNCDVSPSCFDKYRTSYKISRDGSGVYESVDKRYKCISIC